MPKRSKIIPDSKHIHPLVMNGLEGRMLHIKPKNSKKREILVISGQHTSVERMESLAIELSKYGTVLVPDLPGFGGMEPLYKLGVKPDLDTMADYLASFVKLKYNRKRVTIVGISYGFIVVTRMLQKYPELARKVDLLVSLVGLVHYEDFKFKPRQLNLLRSGTKLFSYGFPAWIAKNIFLRSFFITATYKLVADKHAKFKDADTAERQRRISFEIYLWKCNDIRTYMYTINGMLYVDLCNVQVKLPVHHVSVAGDQYFDNYKVEQHMKVIYEDFTDHKAVMNAHMPTIVATSKEIAPLVPKSLRKLLAKAI